MVRLGTCLVTVVVWLSPGELEDGTEGEESNCWVACMDGEVLTLWLYEGDTVNVLEGVETIGI